MMVVAAMMRIIRTGRVDRSGEQHQTKGGEHQIAEFHLSFSLIHRSVAGGMCSSFSKPVDQMRSWQTQFSVDLRLPEILGACGPCIRLCSLLHLLCMLVVLPVVMVFGHGVGRNRHACDDGETHQCEQQLAKLHSRSPVFLNFSTREKFPLRPVDERIIARVAALRGKHFPQGIKSASRPYFSHFVPDFHQHLVSFHPHRIHRHPFAHRKFRFPGFHIEAP